MSLRDRLFLRLLKERANPKNATGPKTDVTPHLKDEYRYTLVLEGMKLIGAGNGAGALGSIAALYYFSAKPALLIQMKASAVAYMSGAVVLAIALLLFMGGLINAAASVDRLATFEKAEEVPEAVLHSGMNWIIVIVVGLVLTFFAFACFILGTGIALNAVWNY